MTGFEQVWATYPRREAKKDALKAWGQVQGDRHVDAILTALAWQTQSDSWRRGFVPLPASYLRGERWMDENPTLQRDPLYPQFEVWQKQHGDDGANITFEQFKAFAQRDRA